jgi:RimJ/RimL family protein N-acetyltransferase
MYNNKIIMYNLSLIEVKKDLEDAYIIFNWRNDIITRTMSLNTEIKPWNIFLKEFNNNYFTQHIKPFFITINKDDKIGYIGFTPHNELNNALYINIYLDPKCRGYGFGKQIIPIIMNHIKENYSKYKIIQIYAVIKKINKASEKIFINNGFIQYLDNNYNDTYEFNTYVYDII